MTESNKCRPVEGSRPNATTGEAVDLPGGCPDSIDLDSGDSPERRALFTESVRCWLRAMRIARERGITVDEDKVRELEKSLRKELSRKDLPYRVRAYLRMLDSPLPSTYEALNVLWEAMSEEEREILNKATYGGARDYHAGRLLP